MNLPGRVIEIFVEGGTVGFSFYQAGGPEQGSPRFAKTKEGTDFQTNTSYYFYAKHPDRAPEPRLIRIYFDGTGKQVSETVEESRPAVGQDDLDDVALRTDLTTEAVLPDGVMMSVLTSVGYILRRFTPESFRLWLGFIFPDTQELPVLREMLEIPDQLAPEYVAPDDTELADLKERLDIPELAYVAPDGPELADLRDRLAIPTLPDPAYVPPTEDDQLADLLDALNRRRRGGLASIPLSDRYALFLAWQIAPVIGFDPIVAKPADYAELVDELTARSIARQVVFGEWGFAFDLLGLPVRIVLEQAEVTVLSAQLAPLFDFHRYVAPTLLEQLGELPDEEKAKIFMTLIRSTTDTERMEMRDIIPCCEDTGPVVPAMNIVVLGHYEPVGTTPVPTNHAPVLNNQMPDKHLQPTDSRVFYLPADEFTDPDGDALTLSAKQTTDAALPAQVVFTPAQRKFEVTDGYQTATAIKVIATDPGGLSAADPFLLTFAETAANQAPVLFDPMPNVTISTADQQTFALPDTQFKDPDGSSFTTTVTLADGSALPVWLSYNPSTRTFTKAQGFTSGQIDVLVTATDPGGLTATDTFTVTVNATTTPPAVTIAETRKRVIITSAGSTRWLLYIKTSPVTSNQTGGSLYFRVRTANGGFYDSGFTVWQSAGNNQGSTGEYYSELEANEGFRYMIQDNTFTGEDTDANHIVYVQLSTSPDGANAQEYTFTVTENQAQSIVIIYPLV